MRGNPRARPVAGFRFASGLVLSLLSLVGCSAIGDFGRLRSNPDVEKPSLVLADPGHTGSLSAYPLTDDERHLRELARGLLASSYQFEERLVVSGRTGETLPVISRPGPEAYTNYVVHGAFRSAAARYAKLTDDTRNDLTRLDPFFSAARRVADLDRKREKSLAHVSVLSAAELANARARVRENMLVMIDVHNALMDRVAIYRFTLERLVIALPSPMAAEAERVRNELERRVASIRVIGEPVVEPGPKMAVSK